MLSDGDLVRNLLGRYCERLDAGDFAGVGALFGPDGCLATDDGTVIARGAAAIAALYAGLLRLEQGSPRTKHLVADTVLEPVGDDVLVARSSYVVLQATDGLPLQPIVAGRYVDRFARADPGWAWVERRFSIDLEGDLSLHLRQR